MEAKKHHIVCFPAPAQGHINPMFKLAKLLHSRGFYITFVHTEFNYSRLAASLGSNHPFLNGGLESFRFETIPDGLPPDNKRGVNDLPELAFSLQKEPKTIFKALLIRLLASTDVPPLSCVISDAHLNFTYEVGNDVGVRVLILLTPSACATLAILHLDELAARGIFPLKDESCLTNGFLDTPVNWIPGLREGAKVKDLPFIRTTNPNDILFNFNVEITKPAILSGSIILNTFDDLEGKGLEGIKTKIPNLCTIGPLALLSEQAEVPMLNSNLWKEDTNCLDWLDKRSPNSVIYVNYGSLTILTPAEVDEFAWGLANSKQHFLWVLRNDLVNSESGTLSQEFMEEIKERGLVSGWVDQERVLKHPSVGVFLTHCGWNSTLESISEGIPMICSPFFADQHMNCFYACDEWGVGIEIGDGQVKRERVEEVIREVMEGEKGKEMKAKAMEWKKKAEEATKVGGSSHNNFEKLVRWIVAREGLSPLQHCDETLPRTFA